MRKWDSWYLSQSVPKWEMGQLVPVPKCPKRKHMQIESLSQCLAAWMEQEGVSVAGLTEMAGYKSKTSVFRLLKDQCNEQTREAFVELLAPHLDEEWDARFRKALRVERYGIERYRIFDTLLDCLDCTQPAIQPCEETLLPSGGQTVCILGLPWPETFRIVDGLIQRGYRVIHYMTRDRILEEPELLRALMMHLMTLPYQAVMLEEEPEGAWNLMATDHGQLFVNGKWFTADGEDALLQALLPEGGIPLYRNDDLYRGSDYISIMEQAYQMESGGAACIAKQTPGLQMIPEEIVVSALMDGLAGKNEPIAAAIGSLRLTLRKRIDLFYHRKKPIHMIFTREDMERFVRTGLMSDQFFAMRPYTPEERIQILQTLDRFSRQDNVKMFVADRKVRNFSLEAYENRGLLVYPSRTSYNTQLDEHRELFLPGQAFYTLFADITREVEETNTNLIPGVGHLLAGIQRLTRKTQ